MSGRKLKKMNQAVEEVNIQDEVLQGSSAAAHALDDYRPARGHGSSSSTPGR